MKALIIAFCVILVIANSLAAPNVQNFMDSPAQLPDGGTGGTSPRKGKREPNMQTYFRDNHDEEDGGTGPRKGKREPGNPIPQSELHDDKKEPNLQTYFRDSPYGWTRPRKGKRENMWSEFDRKAKEFEKVLKDSKVSPGKLQKREGDTTGHTKTIWEDFIDALQM
ncbi:uncharacterized protein LOC144654591 isoform X1 [Oculina patagonica]